MITARTIRGAVNQTFTRNHITNLAGRVTRSGQKAFTARSAVLTAVAVRMVTAPMPVAVAHATDGNLVNDAEPPSILATVAFTPEGSELFTYTAISLPDIQVGVSRATEAEIQAARVAAEARAEAARKAVSSRVLASVPTSTSVDQEENKRIAMEFLIEKYGAEEAARLFPSVNAIATRESHWRNTAQNSRSTAFGIFQFLDATWKGYGYQKTADPKTQVAAADAYATKRYGGWKQAADFWSRNRMW